MRARILAAIAAAPLLASALGAQPSTQPPAAAHRLVTIDVVATDARGRAVETLKPADFELREDDGPITLDSVRLVRVGPQPAPAGGVVAAAGDDSPIRSAADERQAAAADDARLFALYLDDYHVTAEEAERARAAIKEFVDRDVAPRDLIVVLRPLDSLLTIRLTRDREAVRSAIDSFVGRKGDYEPRNEYERDYIAGTPQRIEAARNQVALSALNALAVHLGSLNERRKTLIVASGGVGRVERRRGLEYLPTLDTVLRSANRSNVAVYAVDPREPSAGTQPDESLRRLAEETDGQLIAGDVAAGLRRAAGDAVAYYLLSFRTSHADDGRFRALQARVKKPGIQLRARRGYWTASPDEALRAAILARGDVPRKVTPPEPAPHASTLIRPWFGMARGSDGHTRVTVVWEPAVRIPGERNRQVAARVALTAKSSDGTVLFEGPLRPTGPAMIDAAAGTPSRAAFDAPPGRLRLRMEIQDAAGQVLDQDVRDVSIRDLRGDVAVGTPEVMRARNAREFRTLDVDAAVPVASREFSRTERLLIRFAAYASADTPPAVSAKLLGRTGVPIRELAVVPSATTGDLAIDLPLASFAVGEYVVEVTAKSGARDATDRVTFRVTS
jgi:VWFA-related protein